VDVGPENTTVGDSSFIILLPPAMRWNWIVTLALVGICVDLAYGSELQEQTEMLVLQNGNLQREVERLTSLVEVLHGGDKHQIHTPIQAPTDSYTPNHSESQQSGFVSNAVRETTHRSTSGESHDIRSLGEALGEPKMYQVTIVAPSELLNDVPGGLCSQWRGEGRGNDPYVSKTCSDIASNPAIKCSGDSSVAVPKEKTAAAKKDCSKMGFQAVDSDKFVVGAWSTAIPVGFHGNSKRAEQYQVTPPGCAQAKCTNKTATESALQALQNNTCKEAIPSRIQKMSIAAGHETVLVTTEGGKIVGWGANRKGLLTDIPDGVFQSGSLAIGDDFACALLKATGVPKCWGGKHLSVTHDDVVPTHSFKSITAGPDYACGLLQTSNEKPICWGSPTSSYQTKCEAEGWKYKHHSRAPPVTKRVILPKPTEHFHSNFKDLKCGKFQCCGNTNHGQFYCFGQPKQNDCVIKRNEQTKILYATTRSGWKSATALVELFKKGWGDKQVSEGARVSNVRDVFLERDGVMLEDIPTLCATVDQGNKKGILFCFGDTHYRLDESIPKQCYGNENKQALLADKKVKENCRMCKPLRFASKAYASRSTRPCFGCGIVEATKKVECFGPNTPTKQSDVGFYPYKRLVYDLTYGKHKGTSFDPDTPVKDVLFSDIATGVGFACGIVESSKEIRCWGGIKLGCEKGQCLVPTTVKFLESPECKTSHSSIKGPASCTSCRPNGCNPHFTIIDPKTNTGTCTSKKCPTCKPKACCGDGHKHYVLNTQNLEGVCVRHNDDCTPVCVPIGSDDPKLRRVCTKGCNRLLKVQKANTKTAQTEEELFDIVTCEADKQVVCEPTTNKTGAFQNPCKMSATFKARILCPFSPTLWNLGSTCITNHVRGDKYPQCPVGTSASAIQEATKKCRLAKKSENALCSRLAMSY